MAHGSLTPTPIRGMAVVAPKGPWCPETGSLDAAITRSRREELDYTIDGMCEPPDSPGRFWLFTLAERAATGRRALMDAWRRVKDAPLGEEEGGCHERSTGCE